MQSPQNASGFLSRNILSVYIHSTCYDYKRFCFQEERTSVTPITAHPAPRGPCHIGDLYTQTPTRRCLPPRRRGPEPRTQGHRWGLQRQFCRPGPAGAGASTS